MKKKVNSTYAYCIITGKRHYLYGPQLERKIAKYGSLEEFEKHFISGKARKLLKQGKTVDEIRKQFGIKPNTMPVISETILLRNKIKQKKRREQKVDNSNYLQSKEYLEKKKNEQQRINTYSSFKAYVEYITGGPDGKQIERGGTCQRPDIWYGNDEYCDGCEFYQYCLVAGKRLMKRR